MTTTPNLLIPLLAAEQAQKHVTMNEALLALDTTIQRITDNLAARRLLGLQLNAGVLSAVIHPDRLTSVLKALLAKISGTAAPSRVLNKGEAIEQFVRDLPLEVLPNEADFSFAVAVRGLRSQYDKLLEGAPIPPEPGPQPPPKAPTSPSTPSPAPRPQPRRKTIFKRGEVPVSDARAQDILVELVTLQHAVHPTAVTVLFRVFVERTVRKYADKHGISVGKSGHEKISSLIVESFNHFSKANPGSTHPKMQRVIRAGLMPHHVDVLNRVVHDQFAFASATEIEAIADTFRSFLVALWSDLR